MRIDSHQHFWRYSATEYPWMKESMSVLRRDFLPSDLEPLLKQVGFGGCVAVQARQSLEETAWLLSLAARFRFIRGVVGWVDLQSGEVGTQVASLPDNKALVGVRHVLHDEPDDHFMLTPGFRRGLAELQDLKLAYDLLLFPRHLPVARELVREFGHQAFVLDHIAKPAIARSETEPWSSDLKRLAEAPNVYCKLSGLVTEAKWDGWTADDFCVYLDVIVEAFGPERLMIGSDWPVCTVAGGYAQTMGVVLGYLKRFNPAQQEAILGGNCADFYNLGPN